MKTVFLIAGIFASSCLFNQEMTYNDFKLIIPYLQTEDFKGAYDVSGKLLQLTDDDSSDLRGIVTYMHLFAAAGMVTLDQMSYADFIKNTQPFVGKKVVMSGHPCIDSTKFSYNSLNFSMKEGELQGMTTTSNKAMTNILCFEYFKFASPVDPAAYIGKNVRCGGILESIEVNPNHSKIWISRLTVKDAFIRDMTPR